jgi:hypothetical protein
MKMRHRVLRKKTTLHSKVDIDNVFFSCCILHNMLLRDDGWEDKHKEPTFWTLPGGALTLADIVDDEEDEEDAILREGEDPVDYSAVRGSAGDMRGPEVCMERERDPEYYILHKQLVENFEWQSTNGKVEWLK